MAREGINKRASQIQRALVDYQSAMRLSVSDDPPVHTAEEESVNSAQARADLAFKEGIAAMKKIFAEAEEAQKLDSRK